MKKVTDWMILALVLAVLVDLAGAAEPVTCEDRRAPLMSPVAPTLDSAGTCSVDEYLSAVTECIDAAMPWEYVRYVNCFRDYRNRSYYVVGYQCFYSPLPIPVGGIRPSTPNVGLGLY